MFPLRRLLRRLRTPKFLLLLGAIIFAFLGTFYWMLWDIPQIPWLSSSGPSSSAEVGPISDENWEEEEDPLDGIRFNRPEPLQCDDDKEILKHKSKRFCQYNSTLQDCYELLMPSLHEQPSWVFLGDSSMAKLAYYVSLRWPYDSLNTTSRRDACQNLNYYRLPPPSDGWVPPDPTKGEGPVGYGAEHPYCMDCQKCWNVLMNGPTEELYVEYLVVEYARDVSLPTRVTQTTQETAAYYLNLKSPKVCVVSAGLLDAAIDPPISIDVYIQNVDSYLELLARTCQSVIWIGIPAIVEDPDKYPQRNCLLHEWNNAIYALVDLRGYRNVYIMDIWEKSMNTDHVVGALELTGKFYASLARLFVTLMVGPNMSNRRHLRNSAFPSRGSDSIWFPGE